MLDHPLTQGPQGTLQSKPDNSSPVQPGKKPNPKIASKLSMCDPHCLLTSPSPPPSPPVTLGPLLFQLFQTYPPLGGFTSDVPSVWNRCLQMAAGLLHSLPPSLPSNVTFSVTFAPTTAFDFVSLFLLLTHSPHKHAHTHHGHVHTPRTYAHTPRTCTHTLARMHEPSPPPSPTALTASELTRRPTPHYAH